jgi:hypothetical protein
VTSARQFFPDLLSDNKFSAAILTLFLVIGSITAHAHDVTTKVTWNREVTRIVYARCAVCHRSGGSAFSLLTYQEASPWGKAILDSVLQRTMPPWGAVKGFGNFRNEQALMPEELSLIENWVNGGLPEGNPNDLPLRPIIPEPFEPISRSGELVVTGEYRFVRPFKLDGFLLANQPKQIASRITLVFPDGSIVPLVWLRDYSDDIAHPFLLQRVIAVPAGAIVQGLEQGVTLTLLPQSSHK